MRLIVQSMVEKCDGDLRYKHVEAALADLVGVRPADIPAFRGRLRHLRNIGLPRLPTPGSGKHIPYSRRQALEMLIAIELENAGHKPNCAAVTSESIVRQSPYGQYNSSDYYVIPASPDENPAGYTAISGISSLCEHISEHIKSSRPVLTLINVSELVRQLDAALNRSLNRS